MGRLILAASVVAAVAAGGAASGQGSSAEPAPTLRASTLAPLKLRGTHFESNERVLVTLSVGPVTRRKRATVGADGTFAVDFGLVAIDPCPGRWLVAVATGTKGSRATFKRACRPAHKHPGTR